jgi:hypothetical protein
MRSVLRILVVASVLLVACGGSVALSEEEERWCRTSSEALTTGAVEQAFADLNGAEMLEVMKESFGYTELEGAQIGSRMTVTNRGGFPDDQSRDAWYASDRYVAACRAAYTASR